MPAFAEVLLPPNIDRGPRGGPAFMTTVVVTAGGAEQRIAQWSRPRYVWEVGHSLRTPDQYAELLAFFIARRGRLEGFRFYDWGDHSSQVAGVDVHHPTSSIDATHFQLQKGYTSGGVTVTRTITKPIGDTLTNTAATAANSTVRIFTAADVAVPSGWTVDLTTGIVTFAAAPGYIPKATFEFHIPVRFDEDQMAASLDEVTYSTWTGIRLVQLQL